jgi:amidase
MGELTEYEYSNLDGIGMSAKVCTGEHSARQLALAADRMMDHTVHLNAIASRFTVAELLDLVGPLAGERPFAGVPMLLKDLGASMPEHPAGYGVSGAAFPPEDFSEFAQRALHAGFTMMGRTAIPPYAADVATYNQVAGICRNPYATDCTPGGSSGGSAATVSARVVPIAHATDAAGSIRIPASRCGLLGLKPTRGVIAPTPGAAPFYGFAEQFFLTRTARDAQLLFSVFSGRLGFGCPKPTRPRSEITVARLQTSGLPNKPDDIVERGFVTAIGLLGKLGYSVRREAAPLQVNWTKYLNAFTDLWARNVFDTIEQQIASSSLDNRTERIYEHGATVSAKSMRTAFEIVGETTTSVCRTLAASDVIVSPVTTLYCEDALPPRASNPALTGAEQLLSAMTEAPLMSLANISGTPAISIPIARHTDNGHPVGVQLWSRVLNDRLLLRMADELEQIVGWDSWRPTLI